MRVVLDTNVLVSAVLSRGSPPDSILQAWRRGSFELVIPTRLLRGLEKILARPRIRRRLRWSTDERTAFVTALSEGALVVTPEEELRVIQADPADNRVLEAAARAEADYIVSGDRHLLELRSHEGIRIVTPARFLAVIVSGLT